MVRSGYLHDRNNEWQCLELASVANLGIRLMNKLTQCIRKRIFKQSRQIVIKHSGGHLSNEVLRVNK